jgi:hypothetical protein
MNKSGEGEQEELSASHGSSYSGVRREIGNVYQPMAFGAPRRFGQLRQ